MAIRDKGEGSISQRKDGIWTARFILGKSPDGKRKVKAFYGKTQNEVKKKLREFKKKLAKNEYQEQDKITVKELFQDWLINTKKNELKPSSYDRLEITVNKHIIPRIGFYQMGNITPQNIQNVINEMTNENLSYSTIKKAYNAMHSCFQLASDREQILKNPCIRISLPKQIKKAKSDIVFYSEEESKILIQQALYKYKTGRYKYKYGYAIPLLLNTGMRVGELLALKWCNVDFDEKIIHIKETRGQIIDRTNNEYKYIVVDRSTKTESGRRDIPINKQAEEALLYFKSLGYNNNYVMANSNDNVVSYRTLYKTFHNSLKSANINRGSIHSLRHTFATRLFRNGIDIKIISELLGHSDISITYDIYTHVIQDQKKEAIKSLNI